MTPHKTGAATRADYLLLLLLATLWGASYSFIRVGVTTIPPITFIAGRTLIAGALLFAFMRMSGVSMPRDRATWRNFMVQAVLNSVIPFTLIAWAEQSVEAGLATILNATTPIFVFLMTWLFVRHEPVTVRKLVGVVAGIIGVGLIVGTGALQGLGREFASQLAVIIATISYAWAAIFGRNFAGHHPLVPAAGSMLCGAVMLVPASLVVDRPWTLVPSAESVVALFGLAVFSTALAFVIYFRLLRTLGAIGVTAQAYLRVPIGVSIGVVALGESLAPTAWLGFVFVVLGVAAMTLQPRRARPAEAALR